MAKKKATRKAPQAARRARKAARKASAVRRPRTNAAKKTAKKPARRASTPARAKARPAAKKARPVKKAAARRAAAKKAAPKKAAPKKVAPKKVAPKKVAPKKVALKKPAAKPVVAKTVAPAAPLKKANLDRPRRTVADIHGVPSSLDLDRAASAARTGRAELEQKLHQHTSTSPALTAGDVDADWASADSSGDEAPGGDNPTPDQDVVDEIGRALGVEYDDDQELQGGDEIAERDRHRWELDPGSSDDFEDR